MKKIFACAQFASEENNEYSLADVTPEEYLKKMLFCIEGDELCIAKEADDVSINLAQDLSSADFVVKCTLDSSKVDAGAIVAKEKLLFAACREIALKKDKELAFDAIQAVVGENTDPQGIRAENVLNRVQRLEKLLELGAPDFVVANERLYLIEELALNAFAIKREVIEKDDFPQMLGAY